MKIFKVSLLVGLLAVSILAGGTSSLHAGHEIIPDSPKITKG